MATTRRFLLCVPLCIFLALALESCGPSVEDVKKKIEEQRVEKLENLRSRLSSSFLLGSIVYVGVTLLGPSIAECVRSAVARKLKWSMSVQIDIARFCYWSIVIGIGGLSLFDAHLSTIKPAVWLRDVHRIGRVRRCG